MPYLLNILQKYQARDLSPYSTAINNLKGILQNWASSCYIETLNSGSRAKGTAISIASDVDFLVSLSSECNANNGGLESIYESLYSELRNIYSGIRKQNVSIRINLNGLMVDVTPARKHTGNTNDHWLYVSKTNTRQQTNIQKHIYDISNSGRTNEIKIIKIWRELNQLDFPSIYLEYLSLQILRGRSTDISNLGNNAFHILKELAKDSQNPLFTTIIDPANSNNYLSSLLTQTEKNKIISAAKVASNQQYWTSIIA